MTQWTVPPPPPVTRGLRTRPPTRRGRIAAGVALAVTGHVASVAIPLVLMGNAGDGLWLVTGAVLQVMLFLGAVAGGTVLHGRSESRELGLGLLVGWGSAIPLVVMLGFPLLLLGLSMSGLD
jgi:hypothetical protein